LIGKRYVDETNRFRFSAAPRITMDIIVHSSKKHIHICDGILNIYPCSFVDLYPQKDNTLEKDKQQPLNNNHTFSWCINSVCAVFGWELWCKHFWPW
jgi:hypothetical protein